MAQTIFHLVYSSEARADIKPEDVEHILTASRVNNQKAGITGLLLTRERYFLQLLEGHQLVVSSLYKKICRDQRHAQIRSLSESLSSKRLFPRWSMGYIDPAQSAVGISEIWPRIVGQEKLLGHDREGILAMFRAFNQP